MGFFRIFDARTFHKILKLISLLQQMLHTRTTLPSFLNLTMKNMPSIQQFRCRKLNILNRRWILFRTEKKKKKKNTCSHVYKYDIHDFLMYILVRFLICTSESIQPFLKSKAFSYLTHDKKLLRSQILEM